MDYSSSEHRLQKSCVDWFRMQYKKHVIFAIPNGELREKKVAARLKAEGVLPGVPDLFIPHPKIGIESMYHGLWIEMKNGDKGKLKPDQKEMIQRLKDNGYAVEVARSIDEFMSIVNAYLI